jgi:endoglucanase
MRKRSRYSLRALGVVAAMAAWAGPVPAAPAAELPLLPLPIQFPDLPPLSPIGGSPPTQGPGCAGAPATPGVDPRGVDPRSPNPLAGVRFFVDPDEPAWYQWQAYRRRGMQREADLMWKIAREPRFRWFGRWTRPNMYLKVRKYLERVNCTEPGTVPLMTVLRHQGKSCGRSYTAGGAAEDARTRGWYDDFADAVGAARIVIAFEPDSLGTLDCLARSRRRARLDTLRYGVDVLSRLPNATIYLEAGASDWEPARRTARQLRYIGISKVRGFMLNVTHYDWTGYNIRHGLQISRLTGGKPFIISTAFNGRGPVHYRRWISRRRNLWRTVNVWCHPLKRGLGVPPTTSTSHPKVDAYMWIGRPGYSGGSCNGGPLPVGTWWAERALMFAKYATLWEGPPRGTRNGHHRRYRRSQLGG